MDASFTGNQIRTLRMKKNMTQRELAELLHVTDKAVSKWERGKNYPDLAMLPTLAEALDTTVSELLGIAQPVPADTIAVLSAISQQEKNAIKRSLYQFIIMAMALAVFYLILRYRHANGSESYLCVLSVLTLLNGGTVLGYLQKKFSGQSGFQWPGGQEETLLNHLKISASMWMEHIRGK